jgi:predicted CXXCH cytochrome family protein
MKRITQCLLMAALGLLVVAAAFAYDPTAYVAGSGINNTAHDLSVPGAHGMNYPANPADPYQRICIWCHAPHNTYRASVANGGPDGDGAGPQASDAFDYLPLWNHTLQADTAYSMYWNGPGAPQSGPKASQAIQLTMTPGSNSLLCLSCHDGSVAVNAYGNVYQPATSQSGGGVKMADAYLIGLDQYLGNHHPIGFSYAAAASVDTGLRPVTTQMTGGAAPVSTIDNHLYGGMVECGTCHSVHNQGNTGEEFLWRSDRQSNLCTTCHTKGAYSGTFP